MTRVPTNVLTDLQLDSRLQQVLELRMEKELTLEETGKHVGGLSRERVRQLESKISRILQRDSRAIAPLLDAWEENAAMVQKKKGPRHSEFSEKRDLIQEAKKLLEANGYVITPEDVEHLIILLRGRVFLNRPKGSKSLAETRWRHITYYVCGLAPPIMQHRDIAKWFAEQEQNNRSLSYSRLAHKILADAGKPLHWSAIAEKAYVLGRRSSFNAGALYNALQNHKDIFVRIEQGTYALIEWGVSRVDTYTDIIASVLQQEQRTLPIQTIFLRVNSIRSIKRDSLGMSLEMHPRFYKSIEGNYGLRAWLLPREEQTLRTPEWLVEDSASLNRIARAIGQGYKIEELVEVDKE